MDWSRAICAGAEPDVFQLKAKQEEAVRICGNCPIIQRCRDHARITGEESGTWGGETEAERWAWWRENMPAGKRPTLADESSREWIDSLYWAPRNGKPAGDSFEYCEAGHSLSQYGTGTDCQMCQRSSRAANRKRGHCRRGHEMTMDNTYVSPDLRTACRTCKRDDVRARRQRRRLAQQQEEAVA